MKRFSSSGSLGALVPNFPPKEEETHGKESYGYSKEFQAMLDSLEQEDCGEEMPGKKRRLSSEQVKALEINFEIENKLEPERKTKLAEELGLQPRQVAIWFQNRRARWKAKQLERDYTILKADYDGLKLNFDGLEKQNKALAEKVRELKAKIMCRESAESNGSSCVKEDESPISMCKSTSRHQDFSENAECSRSLAAYQTSHSSALRMEDQQSLFSTDNQDSCNFFSVDQAPTLHWYS